MKKELVVNNSLQPQMLESGAQLPAAGTPGSEPTPAVLSKLDRERLVERGLVSVVEVEQDVPEAVQHVEPAPRRAPARGKSD